MLCIFFEYITLVPFVGFYILNAISLRCCIGWVLDMQMILCIELISLHVWMFIPCVNEYCGHYFIVITCFWSSHGLLLNSILLDRIVFAPYVKWTPSRITRPNNERELKIVLWTDSNGRPRPVVYDKQEPQYKEDATNGGGNSIW